MDLSVLHNQERGNFMSNDVLRLIAIFIGAVALTGCGPSQEQIDAAQRAEQAQQGAQQAAEAATSSQSDASTYSNVVACDMPQSPGMAINLVSQLTAAAAQDSLRFANMLSSGGYAQFCQEASGEPSEENIRNGREVARSGSAIYYVVDRGEAALGFVKH
jgi:Mg-chelatase subunit ChlD